MALSKGEILVMRLAGDLATHPALLMESEEIVKAIRSQIRAGAEYPQILATVSELI
jgi:hypothetical protein